MMYRYFSLVLFLIFILNAIISHSKELDSQMWKIEDQQSDSLYYFMYAEDSVYNINKMYISQDKLQEVLETHTFSSKDKAMKFILEQKNVSPIKETFKFSKIQTEDPDSTQVIWPTENQWSWEWEQKYSQWVKENVDAGFFVKYGIPTDCADVAVSLRWIFSRINFLPAAQTLLGSGRIFSNESMRKEWETLPTDEEWNKDQRFMTALLYLLQNTYTHTLFNDSYPIAITPDALLLGTHFLTIRETGGHTLFVNEISQGDGIYVLYSTTPSQVRKLWRDHFYEQQHEYHESAQKDAGGFLKIRWPLKIDGTISLTPAEEMPNYSLEQYDKHFSNGKRDFTEEVYHRMGLELSYEDTYKMFVQKLDMALAERVEVVKSGFEYCSQNGCPEDSPAYDAYSTPSRDRHIWDYIKVIKKVAPWYRISLYKDWKKRLIQKVVLVNDQKTLTLKEIVNIWNKLEYSSDPNDSVEKRWGINASQMLSYQK